MALDSMETHPAADEPRSNPHKGTFILLGAGLAAALAGDGYLMMQTNHLRNDMAAMQTGTQGQFQQMTDATKTWAKQQDDRFDALATELKGLDSNTSIAIRRARADAQKRGEELSKALAEQHQKVSGEIAELNEFKTNANNKFSDFSTDVDGVRANVETVKASVASTQSELEKNTTEIRADMKRVMGDMGVMSGLIATNSKDLGTLRAMGERNYFEFDLTKASGPKRIGDITVQLKKSDAKRNRFTLEVLADDKRIEKKDKTVNEPVQLYVAGNVQPYEIVVNQVKKDQVTGYLSTPKMKVARR